MTDLVALEKAVRGNTKLVWVETPSNPTLKLTDIAAVAEIAHRAGALLVCDNTWSPIIQRPFALGADLVMHSTTKYFGGHSDVLGGALIAQRDDGFFQRLREIQIGRWGGARSVRLLAGASRDSDAALPDAGALRKRAAGGGVS